MSLRVSFLSLTAVVGLMALPVPAQTLAESAAAAAGGSAAGVAGKVVSDSITKTMGKVPNLLDSAASTGATTTARPVEKASPAPSPSSSSAGSMAIGGGGSGGGETPVLKAAPRPRPHRASASGPKRSPAPAVVTERAMSAPRTAVPALPPPPPLTVADLQKIQVGANRKQVYAALGTPAYRMEIPDEGHLTEVMHYAAAGADLGSVHLSDGTVTEVKVNN